MRKNQPVSLPEPLTEDKQTFLRTYLHVSSGGNKSAEKRSCLFKIKTSSHDHLCIFFPGEFMMQEFVPTRETDGWLNSASCTSAEGMVKNVHARFLLNFSLFPLRDEIPLRMVWTSPSGNKTDSSQ